MILDGKFFMIVKHDANRVIAQCKKCLKNYSGTLFATSNFLSHLKTIHPLIYKEFEEYKNSNYIPPQKKKKDDTIDISQIDKSVNSIKTLMERNSSVQQNKVLETTVANFIAESGIAIRIVELDSFKTMLKAASGVNVVKFPTRRSVTDNINKLSQKMFENIQSEMAKSNFFCTTADIWSSHHRSYLGK